MLHKALSSFPCVRVWFLSTGPKRAAQRQQWNLGLQGRRQYSRGLISSSIYGLGTGVEPCTQAASYHRTREDLGSLVRKSLCFHYLIPNSISFSNTYSYYLIPITCVFSGCSGVCKRRKDYFSLCFRTHGLSRPTLTAKTRVIGIR